MNNTPFALLEIKCAWFSSRKAYLGGKIYWTFLNLETSLYITSTGMLDQQAGYILDRS